MIAFHLWNGDDRASVDLGIEIPEFRDIAFKLQKDRETKGSKVETFEGRSGSVIVQLTRIENVEPESAARLILQRRFEIEGLGRNQNIAYPGEFSQITGCERMAKPEIASEETHERSVFRAELPANSRNSVGVCLNDEMKKRAVIVYWYCKEKRLFIQSESFFPESDFERAKNWLRSPAC